MADTINKFFAHNSILPFYLENQINNDCNYHLCFSYLIKNERHVSLVINHLKKLVALSSHLRLTFTLEGKNVTATIHKHLPPIINFYKVTTVNCIELEKKLTQEPHDICNTSSIKLSVIQLINTDEYLLLFNIHHILMDGNSLDKFIQNLNLLINKETKYLASDYFLQQINPETQLSHNFKDDEIKKYLKKIKHINAFFNFPFIKTQESSVFHYSNKLPKKIYKTLKQNQSKHNLSMFNKLLIAWGIFFAKLNNRKETVINYPTNIRTKQNTAGCFINTVYMPIIFSNSDTFFALLSKLDNELPFYKKIKKLQLNSCIENISSFAQSSYAKLDDLIIDNGHMKAKSYPQIANNRISIKYREIENNLFFTADISSELFSNNFNATLLSRFFNFLNELICHPNKKLMDIDITLETEKNRILYDFNEAVLFSQNKTLIEMFEEQVQKTPEQIALVFKDNKYTYQDLNEHSNQLARYLALNYQIKPDDLIALFLERDQDMLIAILAVLKAGGAYVPIDVSYPLKRTSYILEDTRAALIITKATHQNKLALNKRALTKIVIIDNQKTKKHLSNLDKNNQIHALSPMNLAYVIYTSGTTGNPKGVMIEHQNVVNTVKSLIKDVYINNRKCPLKITAFTSYAFDVSVSEFFVSLVTGGELFLLSNELRRDIFLTSNYILENAINYIYMPPVLLSHLPKIKYPSLVGIIYAGEPCDKETASYWSSKVKLFNYYGPTETSIYATGTHLKNNDITCIGKPILNTTAYILNSDYHLLPIGITGELFIGGEGIARGYLNQKILTKDRFINNPFQRKEEREQGLNAKIYKTGDLARWLPDGNLQYFGRNDTQVKIRGHRIELSEIESILLKFPSIRQAVVLIKSSEGIEHLVGYYVATEKIEKTILKEYLSLRLPDFMIPDALLQLLKFPITVNGKIDKLSFPTPEFKIMAYVQPKNQKEKLICEAFADTLSINKAGMNDDFFSLGGNSIKAIHLTTILQHNFDLSVTDIYDLRTPMRIAIEIPYVKNNLEKNLEKIKERYSIKHKSRCTKSISEKIERYLNDLKTININACEDQIYTVLLTGATGFLGCNLLNKLLINTQYDIVLIVRASSDVEAFNRINHKFEYYFNKDLNSVKVRLKVYAGDIERNKLNLSSDIYHFFTKSIDAIIHTAALTKHYGDYDAFYSANVQATANLLELSLLTKLKLFHYISTISVLNEEYMPNCSSYVFTEDDHGDKLGAHANVYVKTKYEGENIVIKYRERGIKSSIYRVGNLAFMLENTKGQSNLGDNAFFSCLKCLLDIKALAPELSEEEISPTDLTADAIVRLFKISTNQTYHVFNPALYNLSEILPLHSTIQKVSVNKFIDLLIQNISNNKYREHIERYLLHKGWLNEPHDHFTNVKILQEKTNLILKHLGFEWEKISSDKIISYLRNGIQNET